MYFVIGIDAADGHKYVEIAKTIDEATFHRDMLQNIGVDEVHITKDVDIEMEENKYYGTLSATEMVALHEQA